MGNPIMIQPLPMPSSLLLRWGERNTTSGRVAVRQTLQAMKLWTPLIETPSVTTQRVKLRLLVFLFRQPIAAQWSSQDLPTALASGVSGPSLTEEFRISFGIETSRHSGQQKRKKENAPLRSLQEWQCRREMGIHDMMIIVFISQWQSYLFSSSHRIIAQGPRHSQLKVYHIFEHVSLHLVDKGASPFRGSSTYSTSNSSYHNMRSTQVAEVQLQPWYR